ncbi:MAG: DUF1993 domain-containing protein [Deltaproteobacteria bacterium]|nr:DUF1993 domain-containing protein [Deltaproteobacteria bacterium]
MPYSMYSASVPVFIKLLTNGKTWLDKANTFAEAKKFDVTVLLNSRLAPDMFSFTRQLQIATDGAKGGVARLAGVDVPRYEDKESTIAELHARLDKTIAFLNGFTEAQLEGTADKEIIHPSTRGDRKFKGADYLRYYVTPNLYFHMTTAYGILRHNGVDLGKRDFLPIFE